MSTANLVPGGDNPASGGAPDPKPDNVTDDAPPPKADAVSYETHRKLLAEKKKLQDERDALLAKTKERETDELKAKEDYKRLYEAEKAEKDEWKGKYSGLDSQLSESIKLRAVLDKIGGDVESQYWALMDLEAVAMDPETRQPNEASVLKAAQEFEKKHPRLVVARNQDKLPDGAPKGGSGKLSYNQWLALPYDEKLKRQKDVVD